MVRLEAAKEEGWDGGSEGGGDNVPCDELLEVLGPEGLDVRPTEDGDALWKRREGGREGGREVGKDVP